MSGPVRIPTTLGMVAGAHRRLLMHVEECPACPHREDLCVIGRLRRKRWEALVRDYHEHHAFPSPFLDRPGDGREYLRPPHGRMAP